MRFYHRTSLAPDQVLAEADRYFESIGALSDSGERSRTFAGEVGNFSVSVRPEGGHYTRITIDTGRPTQGEAEKLAKGFFTSVHMKVHPDHVARGAH
jgi:hypothetical protein